ncbi:hypothetical protein [Leptolyngbya sp. 7M]|uniref:hypothetical protein n=1 Tax=Leptolyngbya sp. 7M TaxID=2812896 RepID=UPI001B8B8781|nr:hypothetical protein [Leptolyngbya sp. 7M]QYO63339.1 hypothetical protein JVX88_25960 [Leptolyngbya sp. 7M]
MVPSLLSSSVILTSPQELFLSELYALCQRHRQSANVSALSAGLVAGAYLVLVNVYLEDRHL